SARGRRGRTPLRGQRRLGARVVSGCQEGGIMTEGTPVEVVNRQPPGRPEPAPLRVVHAVSEGAAVVAALVAGAIMLGIVIDVLFRTIFGGSVHGLLELVETFMVLVVYLGLAQAERTKTHVRM